MNKLMVFGVVFVLALLGLTWVIAGGQMGDDIVNKLAMLGAVATATIAIFVALKYIRQMQTDKASGKLADENWDGIGEYKNELPFGWAIIFFGSIIWAIWYFLAGYPVNAYSQYGEYNEDVAAHDAKFEAQYANMDESSLKAMGESIFIVQCAPCHGLQADGIDGKAADLHHRIAENSVKAVIMNGSNNNLVGTGAPMPDRNGLLNANTGALITDAEIDTVSKYVAGGMQGTEGADVFAGTCAACHGADGKGMDMVAPNIAEMSPSLVDAVIHHGKKGVIGTMPAFTNLTEVQAKAIDAYVSSLSK
ncbi:MAG: c-type cytochrome [Sulfuricurvum sp.]|jgi:cytochrome c oxidase cbb3-type subunit 3|uniref:cbb3-type cytochrome c oxidase N-terminal domain-containing protein n=1 Tax=Sulfuricurvum sp. TaxID=2025608 RepID=UPI0025D5BDAE|nr:cbb3-type cytochrome c oxidase N-terminal domain-containing protein [Sulfuricurvum sp.]MCK9374037.1 c-type cytochrome [Sulfuricurvum sp.]